MKGVSVVIPIFGEAHQEALPAVVDSVLAQRNVDREVVVSEQGRVPRWERLAELPGVEYVFSRVEGNAGTARNEGLKRASKEFAYFNDADVVFLDGLHLHRLSREIGCRQIFTRIAMRRMLKEEVPGFFEWREKYAIEEAIRGVELRGKHQATLSRSSPPLEEVEFDGRLYTATPQELAAYRRDSDYLAGRENLLWQRTVHCGMTFGRADDFKKVGGYSPDYPVCVYEDSDLQWKLRSAFDVREIGDRIRDAVMHLDHDLAYRSAASEAGNKAVFERRKSLGAATCIEEDVARF